MGLDSHAKSASLDPKLSRRLHTALTCGKDELFQIILDPSMEVLQACCHNPALDEIHLQLLLERRDLTEDFIRNVARLETVIGSHKLTVALVHNPTTPATLTMRLLPHLYLFELVDVCYLPGVTPDQRLAAERAIIQRLPTTPLGNRITLARRGTAPILDALMKEGDLRVVEPCLNNPRLKEAAVFQLVSSARAAGETLAVVARNQRWSNRPNLKAALLKNPNTPLALLPTLLASTPFPELKNLAASERLGPERKRLARAELKRRGY
ncbi:hypothetical protein GURASL_37950 [Geotalea uraniireducens]|uniref:Leucine rich repeat variant n=1 Tax=Geotalea uraniireducens TaxID=351604 RepID=A0ABM8EQW2_9BACT|nr:hypothetical protein [Geotalea uraniireducens]BDV44872.1 hypothetical protein GURASL_37950 [Geotalea uraniireducens]